MKNYALLILLALTNCAHAGSYFSSEESTDQSSDPLEGEFTILRSLPVYAGYGAEDPQRDPVKLCSQNFNRFITSDELLQPVVVALKINNTVDNPRRLLHLQKRTYNELECSSFYPYLEIKDLKEGSTLKLMTPKNQPLLLTVNTQKFLEDEDSTVTFQKILRDNLARVRTQPNYFSSDREQLVKDEILIEEECTYSKKEKKYSHGPRGFDFSILDQPKEEIN